MREPYLVQRLNKPYKGETKTPLQMMSKFGLAATGFSGEARKYLSEICVFDYMGSSEYEFGAIPESLITMGKIGENLRGYNFSCPYLCTFWDRKTKGNKEQKGTRDVYVICTKHHIVEAVDYITDLARGEDHCKERTKVAQSLAEHEWSENTLGWFDLVNYFMFFKDLEMYNNFCVLLGVKGSYEKINKDTKSGA